ncbi:hypothetical protein CEXT_131731 [Caerostris extrusa]|uniref:Uncharacterized protein n=1 Tax=Caerostris extrusa TaxID=172846 RepID=A0AAV4QPR7_CAEEX|nr:hypothetical protein CEXT_131731 [Caerostris extrusa]
MLRIRARNQIPFPNCCGLSSLEQWIEELHFHNQPNKRSRATSTERKNRPLYRGRGRSRRRYSPDGKLCYHQFTFGSRYFPEKCKPHVIGKTCPSSRFKISGQLFC